MEKTQNLFQIVGDFIDCCNVVKEKEDKVLIDLKSAIFLDDEYKKLSYAYILSNTEKSGLPKFTYEFQIKEIIKGKLDEMFYFIDLVKKKYADSFSMFGSESLSQLFD